MCLHVLHRFDVLEFVVIIPLLLHLLLQVRAHDEILLLIHEDLLHQNLIHIFEMKLIIKVVVRLDPVTLENLQYEFVLDQDHLLVILEVRILIIHLIQLLLVMLPLLT